MNEFPYDNPAQKTLSPITRKALADRISKDVDAFCVKEFSEEHRTHLGASIIGKDCSREAWYIWRWVKASSFDGRMLRLFNRGHMEEERFIRWLRGIGCEVWEVDPNTGKQFRIWGVNGHYGGGLDSGGILPYLPDMPLLMEFKTHKHKSFTALKNKESVALSKPEHFSQMCAYGKTYGFRYALYIAVNKDNDELYFEIVELNWNHSDQLANKAHDIINSQIAPAKISLQPSYHKCKMCFAQTICHYGDKAEKNCRSCKYAVPVENAQWFCNRHQGIIPKDFIKIGCDDWIDITIEYGG